MINATHIICYSYQSGYMSEHLHVIVAIQVVSCAPSGKGLRLVVLGLVLG